MHDIRLNFYVAYHALEDDNTYTYINAYIRSVQQRRLQKNV